jgi:integrase
VSSLRAGIIFTTTRAGTKAAGDRVRLPNDPASLEFWAEYQRLTGQSVAPEAPQGGTFDALIAGYKAAPEFTMRTARTLSEYTRHLNTISRIWGHRLVRGVRAKHVLELRDAFAETPTKADHLVSVLSLLIAWGIPRDYADINPCREISDLAQSDGYPPWEEADIDYAQGQLAAHLWRVAAVALYTGQRQSDVLKMDWSAIAAGGDEIRVRQDKTRKPLWIPIHRELRPVLDRLEKVSTRILTNSRRLPWASGFKAAWQNEMSKPVFAAFRERRLVFHGLRKSSVVMLLEAGCTDAEVAAITGQWRQMVEHYSIMVNQRKLARSAILKWQAKNSA